MREQACRLQNAELSEEVFAASGTLLKFNDRLTAEKGGHRPDVV
jgi:hypothetical protein